MATNIGATHGTTAQTGAAVRPAVRRISVADLRDCLAEGWSDFSANRTDVIFMSVIYPVVGLALGRLVYGGNVVPLLFPLAAGFALLGPFAAIGLYELSRRREQGLVSSWRNAADVLQSRSLAAILVLGATLMALFLIWLQVALAIYQLCFGSAEPDSIGAFVHDIFATPSGWALILIGNGVGLVFAVAAFVMSVVSFPLLVDRDIAATTGEKVSVALATSARAVAANPVPMAVWGVTVAVLLALGSIPFLLGLAVVMPVLGHASWHLYRRVVVR